MLTCIQIKNNQSVVISAFGMVCLRNKGLDPLSFKNRISMALFTYIGTLENYNFPQVDDFQNINEVNFQFDGAPHNNVCVRDSLNEKSPNRWISRGTDNGICLW